MFPIVIAALINRNIYIYINKHTHPSIHIHMWVGCIKCANARRTYVTCGLARHLWPKWKIHQLLQFICCVNKLTRYFFLFQSIASMLLRAFIDWFIHSLAKSAFDFHTSFIHSTKTWAYNSIFLRPSLQSNQQKRLNKAHFFPFFIYKYVQSTVRFHCRQRFALEFLDNCFAIEIKLNNRCVYHVPYGWSLCAFNST